MFWSDLIFATLASLSITPFVPQTSSLAEFSEPSQLHKCETSNTAPNFLVLAGGGSPASNEIALEKNVLYFQRVLQHLGYNPEEDASFFFANGNNGQRSVRYLDRRDRERFKVPKIPFLDGSSTVNNLSDWLETSTAQSKDRSLFFYFTGHGLHNEDNSQNNTLLLWNNQQLSVQEFATLLDKLPSEKPVVTMMAQCFSGSFANMIYQGGNPENPIALQTRCGFFATVETLPSVGCTPEVNEADYVDYSSSFFSGLSGQKRTGEKAPSADYNQDGNISYTEAHAFAKIDNESIDLPLSTSENWLRQNAAESDIEKVLEEPITTIMQTARPEQTYVINQLMERFEFNHLQSYIENLERLTPEMLEDDIEETLAVRLMLELVNVAIEADVRERKNDDEIAILDRLLACEQGYWK